MMRKIVLVTALLAASGVWGYPPPTVEDAGLSLTIVGLDQGPRPAKTDWDRRKINVKVFDAEKDIPLSFALSNGTPRAVTGRFSVWMNEDWSVLSGDETVTVGPGEVKRLDRTARAKASALPALYPVHAKFETAGCALHPIAVIRVKTPNRAFRREARFRERIGEGCWRLDVGFHPSAAVRVKGRVWTLEGKNGVDARSRGIFRKTSGEGFASGVSPRRGFQVHPPYATGAGEVMADFPIELPPTKDGVWFRFFNALSDSGKGANPGDGVSMRVQVKAADESAFREIFAQDVPKSGVWLAGAADLSAYAGRQIVLRLLTDPGKKGNTTYDSCAWGDPTLEVGRRLPESDEAAWQAREEVAREKAKRALAGAADPAGGAYLLTEGGRSFGACVEVGPRGVLDAAMVFTDGRETLTIRGFEAEVDGERLTDLRAVPFVGVRVFAERGALRIAWDTRKARKTPDGSPRFTRLAPGPMSLAATRVYAGTGCVWEGMERMFFRGSGFSLSTRHVGMDYANGLSLVAATDLPADGFEVDASNRVARLVTHNDAVFSFVPSDRGAFDAAVRFASVSGYRVSPGVCAMRNRICIDDWSGAGTPKGYWLQAEALRRAKAYGLDDVLYLQHNWQHWGYDARLPEVYPPRGDRAGFDEMVRAARESGYLFGIHDNYVDYYPDAEGFSYGLFCYNEDGTPLEAWYNPGPRSLSYRWLPQAIHGRLRANLALQRDGFAPNAIFLDVFTASAVKDVIDRTGRFYSQAESLEEWCRAWEECREVYGVPDAVTVSEGASDSQIGYVDAGEADHFNPRYQAWTSTFADGERVPWHDAVSHGKMLLFGGGLGFRYSREKPDDWTGDNVLHGWGTDDYLSMTVIGGRVPMGPAFGRVTASTYWMLHDVCASLGQAEFTSFVFEDGNLHRLHSTFGNAGQVWANRETNAVWRLPDGKLLPTYGYYAKAADGVEACVELRDGVRIGWAKCPGAVFVDARPVDRTRRNLRQLDVNKEGKAVCFDGICTDGAFRLTTADWTLRPLPDSGPFHAEIDLSKFGAQGREVVAVEAVEAESGAAKPVWRQREDRLMVDLDGRAFVAIRFR